MKATHSRPREKKPPVRKVLFEYGNRRIYRSDPRNLVVQSYNKVEIKDPKTRLKTGETRMEWQFDGFYGSPVAALRAIGDLEAASGMEQGLGGILDALKRFKASLDKVTI